MSGTRRDFLRTAGILGLGGAVSGTAAQTADASEALHISEDWMGVLVDIPKCIGCRRCEFACREAAEQASIARGELKEAALFKPQPMETFEDKSVYDQEDLRRPEPYCHTKIGRFPNPADETKPFYNKANCFHCNKPACESACIVGAFRKLEDGPVVYDAWKCMGCRYCMVACPFGIPTYEYDNLLTPQVRKCTLCADEGNPNKGKVPACMKICPAEVMTYGKRSELLDLAHEKIRSEPDVYLDHVYGEHEAGGTSWLYLAPKQKPFAELGFVELDSSVPPLRTETIQHGVFKHFIPPLAWYGLLGAMMWVSRPNPKEEGHASAEHRG
ncbi:MAG: 4Fe-4S dicluster domain-containing protein [bacterium]|nr:4Fe-4S dicluster domain-containing protein [bacterium]